MSTEVHFANNLNLLEGCFSPEWEPDGPFVWAPSRFQLSLPHGAECVHLELAYLGEQGTIQLFQGDGCADEANLRKGWQDCFLTVPGNSDRLRLEVGPPAKIEGDNRELGVMIRKISFLDDKEELVRLRSVASNAVLNDAEFRQGLCQLTSYPPNLRVSSEVRCNIPETTQACSYCAWDRAKAMEEGAPAFTLDTLDELGGFYSDAHTIVDCSIGEPMMNRYFGEILSRFDREDKRFSFATNGQLLVKNRRRQILGKDIDVYVSIDAATAEGFRRYRNDQFEKIIDNLRLLCAEKRQHGNLPKVIASFIAMRSNVDELEPYIRLMRNAGVDLVKLRALYLDDYATSVVVNNGYRFDYTAELLSKDELAAFGGRARRYADEIGLPVYVEWDQFESETDKNPGQPLCAEPWKTFYALARGILPCCYGTKPIANWKDQGDRPLDQFLRDVFNSEEYQSLRHELAAGRLAPYCRNALSCPVAKRMAD